MISSQPPGRSPAYSLQNFTILIVEDYDFLRTLMTGMLKAYGVEHIMLCRSGREAKQLLTALESGNSPSAEVKIPDIILCDWLMPDGDGEDFIRWVRQHRSDRIRFLPVILQSAFASEKVINKARDCGANEALAKPLSAKTLAQRILSVIDHPRSFIKSPDYFGPDRRRRSEPWKKKERRIHDVETVKVNYETE